VLKGKTVAVGCVRLDGGRRVKRMDVAGRPFAYMPAGCWQHTFTAARRCYDVEGGDAMAQCIAGNYADLTGLVTLRFRTMISTSGGTHSLPLDCRITSLISEGD